MPTATCRLLFVLVLLAHDRRRVVHVAVTEHPTATWTVQQFREAFPWDELPRYVLHDRDHAFEHVTTIGIREVLTSPGSPWQNAYVERFIGSVEARVPRSRECADGGRSSPRVERVRRLLLTNANASRPEQRCTRSPSSRAADGWPCDRHSAGWRLTPPLRPASRVVSSPSPFRGFLLTPLYSSFALGGLRRPTISRIWVRRCGRIATKQSRLPDGDFGRDSLQLVYCAASAATPIPAIIHTTTHDLAFAREIQRAGAFYDMADCLAISLCS